MVTTSLKLALIIRSFALLPALFWPADAVGKRLVLTAVPSVISSAAVSNGVRPISSKNWSILPLSEKGIKLTKTDQLVIPIDHYLLEQMVQRTWIQISDQKTIQRSTTNWTDTLTTVICRKSKKILPEVEGCFFSVDVRTSCHSMKKLSLLFPFTSQLTCISKFGQLSKQRFNWQREWKSDSEQSTGNCVRDCQATCTEMSIAERSQRVRGSPAAERRLCYQWKALQSFAP